MVRCSGLRARSWNGARRASIALVVLTWLVMPTHSQAGDVRSAVALQEAPQYGVYYDRYEPAFYTGFAPRTVDPQRIHLHLGRGNQLRVTVVLADDVLRDYAGDLLHRYRTYRTLIDDGHLVLTQNRGFEDVRADAATTRSSSSWWPRRRRLRATHYGSATSQLLEQLNPGRVFRIRMPLDELVRRWVAQRAAGGSHRAWIARASSSC